ncbi:MAG: SMI1/KNR4 family protein [Isosphaeraceae bacterium]|nr:SMI1/KNR4 family protein [Isosphaeraceae bacterium]
MFDYKGWVERASQFVQGLPGRVPGKVRPWDDIEPPLSAAGLNALEEAIGHPLPRPLRRFLETASGSCAFGYVWEPSGPAVAGLRTAIGKDFMIGGYPFCASESLADDLRHCREVSEDGEWKDDDPLWKAALPIGGENGNYLGLDLSANADDPPVVYLEHEGASYPIAPSFDAFLEVWEQMGYLDPEWFAQFLDTRSRLLEPARHPRIAALRACLGLPPLVA